MPDPGGKVQSVVWGGLILIVLAVLAVFVLSPSPGKPLPVIGAVPDFSLSDQDGRIVSQADWRGQIVVVDLIFTRCAGQCLLMSATMNKLQAALPDNTPVRLVSITSDPEYDTPAVLKKYGGKYNAREGVWTFLTGPKTQIRELAQGGLKLTMVDKKPSEQDNANDLVIHSTKLALIDQQGRIRAYFDGETSDCIPPLLTAIKSLARENNP